MKSHPTTVTASTGTAIQGDQEKLVKFSANCFPPEAVTQLLLVNREGWTIHAYVNVCSSRFGGIVL